MAPSWPPTALPPSLRRKHRGNRRRPDAEEGEEEESAAARERGRGEGWGEGAMRAGEKHGNGRGQMREGAGQPEHRHPLLSESKLVHGRGQTKNSSDQKRD